MTHFLQRTSLIALIAGAVGASSSASAQIPRPSYPIRLPAETPAAASQPATPPAGQAPLASDTPLSTAPPAAVQSTTLAPLSPVAPAPQTSSGPGATSAVAAPPAAPTVVAAPPPPAAAAGAPRPPAPAAPAYRTVTARTVTGRIVDVDGPPETYKVRKGDTLATIAKRMGTSVAELRERNDLGRRAVIRPGQELKGPGATTKAYTVGQGDTLFSIARRFNVSADDLAAENNLTQARALRSGQRLRLPAGYRDRGPITTSTRVLVEGGSAAEAEEVAETPTVRTPTPGRVTASRPTRSTPAAEQESADEPATRTSTRRSVTGRVIDVEGPPVTYTVKKGDNLDKIADRLNTTVDDLKKDNKLRRATIRPGQKLKGPRSEAKAYVAVSGDTLALIGRRFGVAPEALRSLNGLSRNATIRSGQRIRLPERYRDRGAITETIRTPVETAEPDAATPLVRTPPAARPAPSRTETAPALPSRPQPYSGASPSTPRPYSPPQPAAPRNDTPPPASSAPSVAPTNTPAIADAQISELGRGKFVWPLEGQIVSEFGPKGSGQRNDGLNIGASAGASVRAAAAGDVVYAGDQVPGFGNLVLIKHADGWVTAYGHLARVDVKMQQKVTQGQQIGQAGMTGGVSEPQLHFEVRYAPSPLERARPVDPKLVLPR